MAKPKEKKNKKDIKDFNPETVEQEIKQNGVETNEEEISSDKEKDETHTACDEASALKEQVNSLTAEKADLEGKLLRQLAEFDNFKKRTAREKDDIYTYAKVNCVESILGVIDNFERALETDCSDEGFKKGVEMIFGQFKDTLTKLGVEEIEAQGKPFDPEYHNAVNQIEDENLDENTVAQVFQKGYKVGDKVIRHAMVVVANP